MWIFWALVAMAGSAIWYIAPRLAPSENPFSPLVFSGVVAIFFGLIFSKIFHKTWFDVSSWPLGLLISATVFSTIGLILALNAGGKIGAVSVIVELSLLIAVLFSMWVWREQINWIQMIGIFLTVIGVSLVLYFEKGNFSVDCRRSAGEILITVKKGLILGQFVPKIKNAFLAR
ncbi:DMT family transporter [Candidatus Gracilibacteria bacterium]|nr:DMT family transporter [Candidatus Gracilibacteria bacterium]MCF7819026.1 DMT family transporter [Candidatus Gracilibacteria bacterium]